MAVTKKKPTKKKVTSKTTKAVKSTKVAAAKTKKATSRAASKVKTVKKTISRKAAPKATVAKPVAKKVAKKTVKAAKPMRKMAAVVATKRVKAAAKVQRPAKDMSYSPQAIEKKWQAQWEADKLYRAVIDETRPKHYALTMLPYTSGDLHFGHWYPMAPSDARARYKRMNGYNVLFPIGFDAFGLPAENAAIKRGIHPKEWTYKNIDNMRRQLKTMGTMFDWEREAISADPEYYKWTEWFFIQLFKAGLAYRKLSAVDWCPKDNTTLAREQVVGENRVCERCGTPVIKKDLEQWFFRATNYADELLNFDEIDWPERVKTLQTNWIGRSEGASVIFKTAPFGDDKSGDPIEIFTTRPDTLWGATFMVFSPEHPLVDKITTPEHRDEVETYKQQAARQSDIEREALDKEKTGVFTGAYAINPVNDERIPIWIADYVLLSYGTGAIMAVPAHDERDFAFARKYGLPVIPVIQPEGVELNGDTMEAAHEHEGIMINSGPFNGTRATNDKGMKNPAIKAVIEWLEERGIGRRAVNYRYRDWLISRQRYWGSPIPMIYCSVHGWNPVPEDQLPVTLPEDVEWKPTGESPLKLHPTWKNTTCPICGEPATRETDTMDTFMCSSWYHLRYLSPHYDQGPFDEAEYNYWMPVDVYTGGIEHATMHLLYTRFFHKAMRDAGIVEGNEPMIQLRNQGIILGEDGDKMSKSKGNVVAPDELVGQYGTDALRTYLMFAYRWQEGGPWNSNGIEGTARWLRRVWTLFTDPVQGQPNVASDETRRILRRRVHQTLRRVTNDFENFEFNTIISALMELLNEMYKAREAGAVGTPEWDEATEIYLKMLAPVAPHIAEELWTNQLGRPYSIHQQGWPKVDEAAAKEDTIELPVQINGKVRDRITVAADASEAEIKSAALASEGVQKYLEGKEPKKVIVANRRLVSLVI
ncbi:MAG TPA: leucine--tRNA ligase [Anaerolineales bacterium]|nr:leucine--tRNA ligase [Anaerolineales bacterium]